jgi:predicted ABC-type ATPase
MDLYIIRGLPGSGKTTFAKSLGIKDHFEADMWFEIYNKGKFDPSLLGEAHHWCRVKVYGCIINGVSKIVVSNTFVKKWEMSSYISMAERHGYKVHILVAQGNFKSVHDVPEATMDKMRKNFEW